ncbi:exodeoxyribonuclease V subunit gamma [Nitriliruptor alkaliphilus]|uniref:exodeoxyribonuclease V subunit gamma n=1 Tax=Nitriliruptor alkaliphilus TaxID=427918 RepID=UPI0006983348|nr:exodeoxyribonuclease V subunit gamma [Nitriliruptor alkaliphilus]
MLHVHHADRADALVGALADVLAVPPPHPFAPEIVAVHSRGIERWVAQQLSHRLGATPGRGDGIAAGIEFPFPGRLVSDAITRATGGDPEADPWRPDRLSWTLLEVVSKAVAAGEVDQLGPLGGHLVGPGGGPSDRRLGAVRRVADLFDRYAVHRPALLQAWAAGQDVDAAGGPLPARFAWQPWLWRRLREHVGTASAPERLEAATEVLRAGTGAPGGAPAVELPDRLTLFGMTALPVTYLEVLAALAEGPTSTAPHGRDVHLLLLHPSPALWARLESHLASDAPPTAPATRTTALPRRDQDPTRTLPRNPLLAAWGRDARELQLVVRTTPAEANPPGPVDDASPSATLLQRLQADVRADRAPHTPGDEDRRPTLAGDDRSVQIHRCHGRTRQVEVLRDVLLGLLADDPDLEPRDIIVLCPDIETFAPIVEAVFSRQATTTGGPDGGANATDLRVQLADRSLRRTNPVLRVVAEVLAMADDRVTASAVLDLCARGPVRTRFGFDESALEQLEERLERTGIRWGLDGDHRAVHGVPTAANTWRAGLDRWLVGVAVDDEALRTVGGVPPEGDVEGADVELVGRLAELLDRLQRALRSLQGPQPFADWSAHLRAAADELCEVDADDAWQRLQLHRLLDDVRDAASAAGVEAQHPLTLVEVRELLEDRLQGAPSRASHRTGDLTVCTLVPMRSVPHQVVVLLGMDDEVFPRRTVPDGDDLLAATPLVGDRDARTEDRQLLLDALLAAGSHLVVFTTGHDERTNDERPPAVPVGELLDVVDRTVRTDVTDEQGRDVAASVLVAVDHPLQPFAPARFEPTGIGHAARPAAPAGQPFGFDVDDLRAAEAAAGPSVEPPPFVRADATLSLPTTADPDGPVALHDLRSFLTHPCMALLRQRLQLTFPRDGDVTDDAVPTDLPNGLAQWAVGERLFRAVVAGGSIERAIEVERGRGALPPGHLADAAIDTITTIVATLRTAAQALDVDLTSPGRSVDVDLELPSGRRLRGAVADVVGCTRRAASYSRLGAKHRLEAWVDVLALTAQDPTQAWSAVTLGRGRSDAGKAGGEAIASVSRIGPRDRIEHVGARGKRAARDCDLGPTDGDPTDRQRTAEASLDDLLDLRERGLTGPVPLPCKTAHAYAQAAWLAELEIADSKSVPAKKASNLWTTNDRGAFDNEDRDEANRLVLGDLSFDDLFALPPTEAEAGDGWFVDQEPGRFGRLARRVWWPLFGSEQLEDHRER